MSWCDQNSSAGQDLHPHFILTGRENALLGIQPLYILPQLIPRSLARFVEIQVNQQLTLFC